MSLDPAKNPKTFNFNKNQNATETNVQQNLPQDESQSNISNQGYN